MIPDRFGRPLRSLRVSVTDRCNLRCRYCMPEDEYVWLPRASLLTFEELTRLAGVFARLGVDKVRLTGGEPLLRHDLATLVGLGEASIAIAVAAPHRAAAFEACRYVIEEVKRRVPIWKREVHADGTAVWVDPSGRPAEAPR